MTEAYAHRKFQRFVSQAFSQQSRRTFTDVSEKAKIATRRERLGVVALDYDNDGRMDIFQANDAAANFLYHNDGTEAFPSRLAAVSLLIRNRQRTRWMV